MYIIINKTTNKITQTIDVNYDLQVSENELLQEITDLILIQKIETAHDYELIFDCETVTDIVVTKTHEEWTSEQQPLSDLVPSAEEQKQAEFDVMGINLLIEMGLL